MKTEEVCFNCGKELEVPKTICIHCGESQPVTGSDYEVLEPIWTAPPPKRGKDRNLEILKYILIGFILLKIGLVLAFDFNYLRTVPIIPTSQNFAVYLLFSLGTLLFLMLASFVIYLIYRIR